jgi:hypothetical protein
MQKLRARHGFLIGPGVSDTTIVLVADTSQSGLTHRKSWTAIVALENIYPCPTRKMVVVRCVFDPMYERPSSGQYSFMQNSDQWRDRSLCPPTVPIIPVLEARFAQ